MLSSQYYHQPHSVSSGWIPLLQRGLYLKSKLPRERIWLELSILCLKEGQAAVAEPSSLGGKSLLKEWPRGAICNHTHKRKEKRLVQENSIHSVMFYTIYAKMISPVGKEVTYEGERQREEVREPMSSKHLQCSRNKTRSCRGIIGGNPCECSCYGVHVSLQKFIC